MTSKQLPINLENLLRQRQVEGERIETKAGWNPDAISLRHRRSVLQPRVARHARPWVTSLHAIQQQRGCAPCAAASTPPDGTALRFNIFTPIPRVGLISFGQPWAEGRKPVGLLNCERPTPFRQFYRALIPTPTAFRPPAQGCAARATLGHRPAQ
jgi:hypothetical protein